MFRDLAVGDAEDIHADHGFGSPPDIAAVDGDVVALSDHQTWFVFEVRTKLTQDCFDCRGAVWNPRVVLLIVIAEEAVENTGIAVNETSLDPCKCERFVRLRFGRRHSRFLHCT